jgi:hypothetical protein
MTNDPRFYNLESDLPAGAFGSVCAATAVTTEGTPAGTALLEYLYVLTRGEPRLFLTSEEMPLTGPLSEATAAELHEEGRTRLKRALEDRLEARASELAKPDMALTPLDLKHTEARPLMGAAMRGEWTDEIRTLAATVKTPALKRYCEAAANSIAADRHTN